jgi:SP family sugar:H+ symporter-like MFS transporter
MIYETKGLSLEQVDELYGIISKAWKSQEFRPAVQFTEIDPKSGREMSLSEVAQNQERKRSVQHDEAVVPPKVDT